MAVGASVAGRRRPDPARKPGIMDSAPSSWTTWPTGGGSNGGRRPWSGRNCTEARAGERVDWAPGSGRGEQAAVLVLGRPVALARSLLETPPIPHRDPASLILDEPCLLQRPGGHGHGGPANP